MCHPGVQASAAPQAAGLQTGSLGVQGPIKQRSNPAADIPSCREMEQDPGVLLA